MRITDTPASIEHRRKSLDSQLLYVFNNKKNLRYCECCKTHKPFFGKTKVKGWVCKDCKNKE